MPAVRYSGAEVGLCPLSLPFNHPVDELIPGLRACRVRGRVPPRGEGNGAPPRQGTRQEIHRRMPRRYPAFGHGRIAGRMPSASAELDSRRDSVGGSLP
jgi:hypothetical protein